MVLIIIAAGFLVVAWKNASIYSIDDKLVFTTSGVPSAMNFLPDCWQYTYGDTIQLNQSPTASGSVSIKAPSAPGTYTIYYCLNNGYTCPSNMTITVTSPNPTCYPPQTTSSTIKHVITIISENHSFDSYFGRYCTAEYGSKPSCNTGRLCCESYKPIPGLSPTLLNDAQNIAFDPCHSQVCEICEMNGGLMDRYSKTGGNHSEASSPCPGSNDLNFAIADGSPGSASEYWKWAQEYAMSDSFFQSTPGASSQSEMYFARGAYVFGDNSFAPGTSTGRGGWVVGSGSTACSTENCVFYEDPTILDLLQECNVSTRFYHVGWPGNEDATDNPFLYYPSLSNGPNAASIFVPFTQLAVDIENGLLPAVSYVKGDYHGYQNNGGQTEHPGGSISDGEAFNKLIIDWILSSPLYQNDTVIFLVPDESGGFRDGKTPPPRSSVDSKIYGARTPFLAVGNMVKNNYISHVVTEPASLIRFIESNWLADAVPGQLQTRDAIAGSLNDLFDQDKVGFLFP
ncbi:UNVERIFIED_CONTAM: hypothetical protein HDU68_000342 [Siphonaria sp. JEL0065]|nr:hypothetical protein HDU68_000342 [Siphonaria sp. JEL0065]